MASILSAGTTSGTALNMSGDTSGVLQLASNNGTTAVTIDTSQKVGIGNASPSAKLDVATSTAGFATILTNTNGASDSNGLYIKSGTGSTEYNLRLSNTSGSTDFMAVKGNGNVGIGTASPAVRLNVTDSSDGGNSGTIRLGSDGTYYGQQQFRYNSSEYRTGVYPSGNMTFYATGSENMRITSTGQLFVNTTSSLSGALENFQLYPVTSGSFQYGMMIGGNGNGYTVYAMRFLNTYTPAVVGSIVINNTTTSFNTMSDYRLKENIAPLTGALAKVSQLKPVTYKWKSDGSNGEGFIAHELVEVVPQAVTGAKDAVEEDGTPHYQGIDTSFLVATLTAAIQELKAINDTQAETINALTARIVALESK